MFLQTVTCEPFRCVYLDSISSQRSLVSLRTLGKPKIRFNFNIPRYSKYASSQLGFKNPNITANTCWTSSIGKLLKGNPQTIASNWPSSFASSIDALCSSIVISGCLILKGAITCFSTRSQNSVLSSTIWNSSPSQRFFKISFVNAPVPHPTSNTRLFAVFGMDWTIALARKREDGAIAPVVR